MDQYSDESGISVEKISREKRKKIEKRDKEQEFNIFYDTSRLTADFSLMQQKLHTVIVIGQSEITSLRAIAELNNLKELWIVECSLKDVMSLEKSILLEKLYLYANEIREIPDFSNLKRLKILSLARNKIHDLGGLRDLIALRDLNVADNEIRKIDNIFSSSSQLSHINLSGNPIYDLQDVENLWLLKNLKSIEFDDPVYGKCPLIGSHFNYRHYLIRRLPRLREIDYYSIGHEEREDSRKNEISFDVKILERYLSNGSLDSIFFFKLLSSKEFLHIKHLKIVECSIVEDNLRNIFLPQLETLDLSKNRIESLKGLTSLKKLHTLCVSHNQIGARRENFEKSCRSERIKFPKMTIFYADNNNIRWIGDASIPKMPSLKYFFLQNNKINDIDGIQDFPRLNTVVLDNNKIESIVEDGFSSNICLRTLFLENNNLTCLRFAKKLRNIERLFVANNKITDKDQLINLGTLAHLTEMTILGNPLIDRCDDYHEILKIIKTIKMIDGHSLMIRH